MRTNNILGLVYASVHEDLLSPLTEIRSMASVPFGGRYRMIDFTLSNLVNAGIGKVGVITKHNYQSLMDHVQNGKAWDLDRKNGGLVLLPPYLRSSEGVYKGHIDALYNVLSFLKYANEEYVVLCDSDVICNVDIADMLEKHLETKADFTVAYTHGNLPENHEDIMVFDFEKSGKVSKIKFPKHGENVDYSLDIIITGREFLINLIEKYYGRGKTSISRHLLAPNTEKFNIYGYKANGFAVVMDSVKSYFDASMLMLDGKKRNELFLKERPVYTKTHDRMPTRYGVDSVVENSLVADGCVIEGTVENCILFRGVRIDAGAVVKNSIIMQNSSVEKGAELNYVIVDKDATVTEGVKLCVKKGGCQIIKKGETV